MMATPIDSYLEKILYARYGEEVRGSIHDALLQTYTSAALPNDSSFKATGGADQYIYNVKVISDVKELAISDIRNNYNGDSIKSFKLFKPENDHFEGNNSYIIAAIEFPSTKGHLSKFVDSTMYIEFDYDISSLGSTNRFTGSDNTAVVRNERLFPLTSAFEGSSFKESGGVDKFIKNAYLATTDPRDISFAISDVRNDYESGGYAVRFLVSDDDEIDGNDPGSLIVLPSISGHYSSNFLDSSNINSYRYGYFLEFDYDLSSLESGDRYAIGGPGSILRNSHIIRATDIFKRLSESSFKFVGGADRFISNVKVNVSSMDSDYPSLAISDIRNKEGNDRYTIRIFKVDKNGYFTDSSDYKNGLIDLGTSPKGHFSGKPLSIEPTSVNHIEFDYDLSGLSEGTHSGLTDYSVIIKNSLVTVDDQSDVNASIAMFEKIGVIGDSFASGEIYVDGSGHDYYNLSWGQILARRNGAKCINFSKGALSTRMWLDDEDSGGYGLPLLKSSDPMNLYFLVLGINDAGGREGDPLTYLGSESDMTSDYTANPNTFYGNYAKIIEEVKKKAPNSKLVISTMASDTGNYAKYNEAIRNIASHYGIPCLEQRDDPFFTSDFYLKHMIHGHPTAAGYSGMAMAFERLFSKVVTENFNYFADYIG